MRKRGYEVVGIDGVVGGEFEVWVEWFVWE